VSRDKEENFVGLQRGGYGNPFDVTTTSEAPLAQDFTKVIVSSLKQKGITAAPVKITPRWNGQEALQALMATRQENALLVTLREWKSDTYMNTALLYDVTIQVFGKGGETLAQKSLQGKDDLGGDFINPPGHAKEAVPKAFAQKLEELFNDEKIVESLN